MKQSAKIFVLLCIVVASLRAQEEIPRGLLNIVNMVPGESRVKVMLGEDAVDPRGMGAGSSSGWFSLEIGQKTLVATMADGTTASEVIELTAGAATVYAIYVQPTKARKAKGDPSSYKIKISAFPTFPARRRLLKFVSLCDKEMPFRIAKERVVIPPRKTIDSPKWSGAGFAVSYEGVEIGKISEAVGNSNYYIFIAPGIDGTFIAAKANADHLGYRKGISFTKPDSP